MFSYWFCVTFFFSAAGIIGIICIIWVIVTREKKEKTGMNQIKGDLDTREKVKVTEKMLTIKTSEEKRAHADEAGENGRQIKDKKKKDIFDL